jgi:uncharacterized glyoxalase superfamily protein PhnB
MAMNDVRVSPVFRYRDGAAAISWLEAAFGFTTTERHAAPDGTIVHAGVGGGASAVGISSAGPEVAGNPWTTVRAGVYICTADVDAAHRRAVAAGATIASPLTDMSYGAREFSVRDPEGRLWSFGTYDMAAKEGERTIFPALKCGDGKAVIGWMERALGFVPGLTVPGADGAISHAEMSLGQDVVMLGGGTEEPNLWGTETQCTCVYVADVDTHHAQAVSRGARVVQPPEKASWGSYGYYVRDLDDFLWGFSDYRPAGTTGARRG